MKKWLLLLSDLRFSSLLLLCFFIDTLFGTLIQGSQGLWAAQQEFFHTPVARIPLGSRYWLPFPGMPTLGFLALLNLLSAMAVRLRWQWKNAGLIVLHLGLIGLLLASAASWLGTNTGVVELSPREVATHYEFTDAWELVLRVERDSGIGQWSVPLEDLRKDDTLGMGPLLPGLTVQGYFPNGLLAGKERRPLALEASGDPAQWTPVLSLALNGMKQALSLAGGGEPWALGEGQLLYLRKIVKPLPVPMSLLRFVKEMHPGTGIGARYESTVDLLEKTGKREVRISMNEPLRIGNYTFYQSSYSTDPATGEDKTLLAVVENPWRSAPYAATLAIVLGLFWHAFFQVRRALAKRASLMLMLALGLGSALPAEAAIPASALALPVQVDGRVKPMDTYARQLMLGLSGRSRGASEWFFGVLLGDGEQDSLPMFLVENPENRDALGLRGKARDRYSWAELEPLGARLDSLARQALAQKPRLRSRAQSDLLRIADAWNRYYALRHALDPVRELPAWPKEKGPAPVVLARDFAAFASQGEALRPLLDSLLGLPADRLDASGKASLDWVASVLASARAWNAVEFPVWPGEAKDRQWKSPGAELFAEGPRLALLRHWEQWRGLRAAWKAKDMEEMARVAELLGAESRQAMEVLGLRPAALDAELLYNRMDPFFRSMLLYAFSALLGFAFLWTGRLTLGRISYGMLALAWLLQAVGIGLRVFITLRPPATNLYDTFVFSGICAVALLLVAGRLRRLRATPLLAGLCGSALLMLARRHGMDGDTMPVLSAVLDSNFWLSIHVLSITLGYAAVLGAGLYAHAHLAMRKYHGEGSTQELSTFATLRLLMMIGLFFTCAGTLLGAIWADQSWGRFWGWDPKENGALLIILWLGFLFHAQPAGWLGRRGFSLGSLFAIQTVLFAWFGVNLMGVGLHSYGFTQGTLQGLLACAALELAYAAWALWPKRAQCT